jgi:hypothetical protein
VKNGCGWIVKKNMNVTQAQDFLRTLSAVRSRTSLILSHPAHLQHFDLDLSKLSSVIDAVLALIERDYQDPNDIPAHSRWRHFEVPIPSPPSSSSSSSDGNPKPKPKPEKRIDVLLEMWEKSGVDEMERVRRLLDLFVVSVLLDAGLSLFLSLSFPFFLSLSLYLSTKFLLYLYSLFTLSLLTSHSIAFRVLKLKTQKQQH